MTYKQRDFGGMAPCDRTSKWWLVPFFVAALLMLVFLVVAPLLDVPVVYMENGTGKKIACQSSDMTVPQALHTPECREILINGRYDKVWVALNWRP